MMPLCVAVFFFIWAIRPAAAQVEAAIVSEHAPEFIRLPQARPSDAPILPRTFQDQRLPP
jgi:hypothetical protein